jgi:hypothetical protein
MEVLEELGEGESEGVPATCGKGALKCIGHTSVVACQGTSEERCWLKIYEESKETHLDSSSAVNLCSTIIVAPQRRAWSKSPSFHTTSHIEVAAFL